MNGTRAAIVVFLGASLTAPAVADLFRASPAASTIDRSTIGRLNGRAAVEAALADDRNVTQAEAPSGLWQGILKRDEFPGRIKSFSAFRNYYRRAIDQAARMYPNGLIRSDLSDIFSSFSAPPTFPMLEVHLYPFFPISFMVHDDSSIKVHTIRALEGANTVHGMRVTAKLAPRYRQSKAKLAYDLAYLPTLNARAMGFTYAQLILPLSKNVRPAGTFAYNGMNSWGSHDRLQRDDQAERPIELTNFAHSVGSHYTVSAHPDFAVEPARYGEPMKLTFFLWKRRPAADDAPDFVFQAHID